MIQTTAPSVGVDFTEDALIVNGKTITVYAEKEAQHIPWQAAGAEVIVECTGFYTSAEIASPSPGRRAQSADFRPRRRDENHRLQRQR